MIINAFMKKFGFGYTGARHVVIERDGKLVMTFAPEGAASFMPSVGGAGGGLEIALVRDGQPVDYTYTATQSLIELTAAGGGSVRIAYDSAANALRFEGEGAALRLDAKGASMGVTSLNTGHGTELSMGGGKYLFTAPRGTISFDDTWLLGQFHSVTPVLDIAPEGGAFELVAYDLAADAPAPDITKTFAQCAETSEADFKAFCGRLVPLPEQYGDVRDSIAYLLWQ
ncbi:MAG: hypothetical protein LBJ84_04655, partial [Oscillospiraceae bacterium]|nr:hypothetical protein [Oscillospiraceae bacterium]